MDRQERRKLKDAFCIEMTKHFHSRGFRFRKEDGLYLKSVNSKYQEGYGLTIQDGAWGYMVTPGPSLRVNEVERIFFRTAFWGERGREIKATVGTSVGLLIDSHAKNVDSFRIRLESKEDLEPAICEAIRVYEQFAIPYFDRFRDLKEIDAVINDRPRQSCIHIIMPYERCSTGLIVAKLTGRSNYGELAEYYGSLMKNGNNGFYWRHFEALLQDLASGAYVTAL